MSHRGARSYQDRQIVIKTGTPSADSRAKPEPRRGRQYSFTNRKVADCHRSLSLRHSRSRRRYASLHILPAESVRVAHGSQTKQSGAHTCRFCALAGIADRRSDPVRVGLAPAREVTLVASEPDLAEAKAVLGLEPAPSTTASPGATGAAVRTARRGESLGSPEVHACRDADSCVTAWAEHDPAWINAQCPSWRTDWEKWRRAEEYRCELEARQALGFFYHRKPAWRLVGGRGSAPPR
jgi:hypothetical protein